MQNFTWFIGGGSLTPLVPINMHDMKISTNAMQEQQTIAPFYTGKRKSFRIKKKLILQLL